jgi:hypothetical protein
VIHIITVHHNTDRWVDLQLKYVSKHVKNYKLWAYFDGVDHIPHKHKFDFCQEYKPEIRSRCEVDHIEKLNSLTNTVLKAEKTKDTDLILWLDSDALPIRDLNAYIDKKLANYCLLAINRPENGGDLIPHPSFTCTTVSFWKKHKFNWDGVPGRKDIRNKHGLHDAGGKLYQDLLAMGVEWYRLLRTRSITKHQVFFTVYDNVIYHHGAGSRILDFDDGVAECRGGDFGSSYKEYNIFDNLDDHISKLVT